MTRSLFTSLPEAWRSVPAKHATSLNPEVLPEGTPEELELSYVDIAALEGGDAAASFSPKELTFGTAPSRARRVLRGGDTILSTVRTYLKAVANFPEAREGLVASTGFAVLRPNGRLHPRFAYWAALSEPFIENVVSHSEGVSYPAINPSVLGSLHMPMPPLDKQERIANFLDEQTARIDALIAGKEQLTSLLLESLSGAIESAVLPPDGSSVRALRRVVRSLTTGPFGSALHSSDYVEGGVPVINPAHIKDGQLNPDPAVSIDGEKLQELASYRMTAGQLVVGRRGEMGRCAVVDASSEGWVCGTGCLLVSPDTSQVNPSYLYLVISSRRSRDWLELESVGSTMDNLNTEILGRLPGYFPGLSEQRRRTQAASEAAASHGRLLSHVHDHIARLREYRSSLISAAVTGQLDLSTFKAASTAAEAGITA